MGDALKKYRAKEEELTALRANKKATADDEAALLDHMTEIWFQLSEKERAALSKEA